jgi:hypothetical protein
MRQSERDMGKFTQAVNSLMEWVEDVDGVECKRRRLIIVTWVQGSRPVLRSTCRPN